jgi:DNA-binding NtrC family response regulator
VRELASVLDRAMLFATDALVETDLRLPTAPPSRRAPDAPADPGGAPAPPPSAAAPAAQPPTPSVAPSRTLAEEYQELERRRIVEALDACGGNQSRAATVLGISRKTLVTRIAEFGLPRPRKR